MWRLQDQSILPPYTRKVKITSKARTGSPSRRTNYIPKLVHITIPHALPKMCQTWNYSMRHVNQGLEIGFDRDPSRDYQYLLIDLEILKLDWIPGNKSDGPEMHRFIECDGIRILRTINKQFPVTTIFKCHIRSKSSTITDAIYIRSPVHSVELRIKPVHTVW